MCIILSAEYMKKTLPFSGGETGWWFSSPDRSYMAQNFTDCCPGYQESVDLIVDTFKTQVVTGLIVW